MLRDDPHGPAVLGHPRSMPPMPPPAPERLAPPRTAAPGQRWSRCAAPRPGHGAARTPRHRARGSAGAAPPAPRPPGAPGTERGTVPRTWARSRGAARCSRPRAERPPHPRRPPQPGHRACVPPHGHPQTCPACVACPPRHAPARGSGPAALGGTFAPSARGGTGLRGERRRGCRSAVPPGCAAAEPPAPLFPARCCRTLNYTPSISRI